MVLSTLTHSPPPTPSHTYTQVCLPLHTHRHAHMHVTTHPAYSCAHASLRLQIHTQHPTPKYGTHPPSPGLNWFR